MRILRQWRHHDGKGLSRQKRQSLRCRYPAGALRRALSLRHSDQNDAGPQAIRAGSTPMKREAQVSRRTFIKGSAALVVGFGATGLIARFGAGPEATAAQGIN